MCAIGDLMHSMTILVIGSVEFKELFPIIPDVVKSLLVTFSKIENFQDLPESSWLELATLSTLDLNEFHIDEHDKGDDFKSWLVALQTTSLALLGLRAELASTENKTTKVVSSRKELGVEYTAGDMYTMRLELRKSRFRTEFRSCPAGGDRSPEHVLSVLESPDSKKPFVVSKIRVQPHPRGGFGIFATEDIPANEVVLVEHPLFSFNDDSTGKALCHHCHRTITTACACERCQEVYCSDQCRKYAASTYHTPICGTNYKAFEATIMEDSKTSLGRGWCVMVKMIGAAAMLPRKSPGRPNTPLDIPALSVLSRCTDVAELSESMRTESEQSIVNVLSIAPMLFNHLGAIAFDNPALDFVCIQTLFDTIRANSFQVGCGGHNSYLAHGIFLWGSFFNHACEPNTRYLDASTLSDAFSPAGKAFYSAKAIAKGEELSISYADLSHLDPPEKKWILKSTYGFECQCKLCKRVKL